MFVPSLPILSLRVVSFLFVSAHFESILFFVLAEVLPAAPLDHAESLLQADELRVVKNFLCLLVVVVLAVDLYHADDCDVHLVEVEGVVPVVVEES